MALEELTSNGLRMVAEAVFVMMAREFLNKDSNVSGGGGIHIGKIASNVAVLTTFGLRRVGVVVKSP